MTMRDVHRRYTGSAPEGQRVYTGEHAQFDRVFRTQRAAEEAQCSETAEEAVDVDAAIAGEGEKIAQEMTDQVSFFDGE